MSEMNNKPNARLTTGGSTRKIVKNWEIIKLRKTHGKKTKLEINKGRGSEYGGSE